MAWQKIVDLLNGEVAPGTEVTVKGWVRTRRDSKAGLSFLHVHDGTCFNPIQVVVAGTLPNYESDVLRLTAGCSVEIDGTLVASVGKGQAYEVQASAVRVDGWVENADTYPISPKRHTYEYLREV
ncbi:MAG: OB-fold nucleic acid binding domain-containing protein, partial [Bacteroidales bacterium]